MGDFSPEARRAQRYAAWIYLTARTETLKAHALVNLEALCWAVGDTAEDTARRVERRVEEAKEDAQA